MKLKWNGFDLELTVEELKQMVKEGLIDPNDEKVPYPDDWKDLLKRIPEQPNQPLRPSDPLQPYVPSVPSPYKFPVTTAYGCQSLDTAIGDTPLNGKAVWDGTTALGGKDEDDGGKPRCLRP